MKVSPKQANLLAKEVVKTLIAKKSFKVSDNIVDKLKEHFAKEKELNREKNEINERINKHDAQLYKITGKTSRNVYNLDGAIKEMERQNLPTVQQVEDEIILRAMFANEDDMQKFLDSIVKKFEKKLQNKVLAN